MQFRVAAKSMVDWICDYYQGVENLPVRSELHVGDVSSLLPPEAPVGPESWTKISQDFQEKIMPGEMNGKPITSQPKSRRRLLASLLRS